MAPEQLKALQDPEVLKAFFADTKTSEIQSRLDAIKGVDRTNILSPEGQREALKNRLAAIAEARKEASY